MAREEWRDAAKMTEHHAEDRTSPQIARHADELNGFLWLWEFEELVCAMLGVEHYLLQHMLPCKNLAHAQSWKGKDCA